MTKKINKKSSIRFLWFAISVFVILTFSGASFLRGDVTLAVPETFQEYSNWCWAGCSEAVLDFYGQYPSQCQIANYAWNTSRCCQTGYTFYQSVKGCNKANFLYGSDGSIEGILNNWGVSGTGSDSYISWISSVSELDNDQPFVMRFAWSSGGGHFLVTYGYITSGSYLKYMDPWPGEGYTTSLYTYTVSSSEHDWTHTLITY